MISYIMICLVLSYSSVVPPQQRHDITRNTCDTNHSFFRGYEFILDSNYVYSQRQGSQIPRDIVFDGTNYLVVWSDFILGGYDIQGTRVSQSGETLDSIGFPIAIESPSEENPCVAFDGTNYLVVYTMLDNMYCVRVDPFAHVLDPAGIPVCTLLTQSNPSVVFDGVNYLAVWSSQGTIYGARITTSGIVLDTAGIAISNTGSAGYPKVAVSPSNYFVVWEEIYDEDAYGARVGLDGVVIDTTAIPLATSSAYSETNLWVVFGNSYYLTVWENSQMSLREIYGIRVDTAGNKIDTSGFQISPVEGRQENPCIDFDGSNYGVTWLDESMEIRGTRVTEGGVVLDSAGFSIAPIYSGTAYPVTKYGTACYLTAWKDWTAPGDEAFAIRFDPAGAVLDSSAMCIAWSVNNQREPAISYADDNYLVTWADRRQQYGIYGVRVDSSGIILDDTSFCISEEVNIGKFDPNCTFGSQYHLVVWHDMDNQGDRICGARVTPSGTVVDQTKIIICDAWQNKWDPDLSFDGVNYLVVWSDERNAGDETDIYGTRVTEAGMVYGPDIAISIADDNQWGPSILFNGTDYFVVWADRRGSISEIYGTFIDINGGVSDTAGMQITDFPYYEAYPDIAFDGTQYLLVWYEQIDIYHDYNIRGARLDASGNLIDSTVIHICDAPGNQEHPHVYFRDTSFVVIWDDYRNSADCDIYGAKINSAGQIIDTFCIVSKPDDQLASVGAFGPGEQFLVAYSGWTDSMDVSPVRTMRIWGELHSYVGCNESAEIIPSRDTYLLRTIANPVRTICNIQYNLPHSADIRLMLFDVGGRLVDILYENHCEPGLHEHSFNMEHLAQGVYFIRLEAGPFTDTRKIILIK